MDKKQEKLIENKSNKNDILKLLGSPSSKSAFDHDLWIYIERKSDNSNFLNLGSERIIKNNVLVLEINSMGLLEKKDFLNINDMKNIKFNEETTDSEFKKKTFIYDFLSTLRKKMNDPLGKRRR